MVGAFSLVGVSAKFGSLGGMLIGYSFTISSTSVGVFSLVGMSAEFVPGEECWSAMVVKFTPIVDKFTPIGACSLVGVSAEFGTLGGMLIGYSR